jgi:hypothetical protein
MMVPLDRAAQERMVRFAKLMQEQKEGTAGLMRSAIGKARGFALRISLVLEHLHWCAEDGYSAPPETIRERTFLAAAKLVAEYLMPMAERTYGDAACTELDRNTATLARWIAKDRPAAIHVRNMQRDVRLPGLTTAEAIHAACRALVEAGWLGRPADGAGFQQRGDQVLSGLAASPGDTAMTDWASLFRSLTADTLDSVDTVSTIHPDADEASTPGRHTVNTVQSVNVSKETGGADRASTSGRQSVNSVQSVNVSDRGEGEPAIPPLAAALAALKRRRPDCVESGPWQRALEDGHRFLIQWGEQAAAFGWTAEELFGLDPVAPLRRYDVMGLIWFLQGCPVVARCKPRR